MSCKFCHECNNLRPVNGSVKCAKGHQIKYQWPQGSTDLTYGFHAPAGCNKSFVKRTSDYYEYEGMRGRRPKLLTPAAVLKGGNAA